MNPDTLSALLTNQTYRGLVNHRSNTYTGEHDAIVSEDLFKQVQSTLSGQGPGESAKEKLASPTLLKGMIFDAAGNRLQPTHSNKHGRKYRYYVTASMIRDAKANPDGMRIPASDLECIVIQAIASHLRDQKWLTDTFDVHFHVSGLAKFFGAAAALAKELEQQPEVRTGILSQVLKRVEVDKKLIKISVDAKHLQLILSTSDTGAAAFSPKEPVVDIRVVGQFLRCGKQVRLVVGDSEDGTSNFDKRLVREIVQSRRWFEDFASGRAKSIADLSKKSKCSAAHVSRRISLAFMAPDIVERIMYGTQPIELTPERLKKACPLPVLWEDQRSLLLH